MKLKWRHKCWHTHQETRSTQNHENDEKKTTPAMHVAPLIFSGGTKGGTSGIITWWKMRAPPTFVFLSEVFPNSIYWNVHGEIFDGIYFWRKEEIEYWLALNWNFTKSLFLFNWHNLAYKVKIRSGVNYIWSFMGRNLGDVSMTNLRFSCPIQNDTFQLLNSIWLLKGMIHQHDIKRS